ncbi:hypothetical protein D3C80_859970 [compost metagenome]
MFGKRGHICSKHNGGLGCAGHSPMVAVLSRYVEKSRNDDIRPLFAISSHKALDDTRLTPTGEGRIPVLGKPEVVDRIVRTMPKPGDIRINDPRRLLHLARAQDAESTMSLRSECILPSLATRRAGNDHPHAMFESQKGEQAVLLIVRMGAGIHHRDSRFQPGKLAVEPDQSGSGHLFFDTFARAQHWAITSLYVQAEIVFPGEISSFGVTMSNRGMAAAPRAAVNCPVFPRMTRGSSRCLRLATDVGSDPMRTTIPSMIASGKAPPRMTVCGSRMFSSMATIGPR